MLGYSKDGHAKMMADLAGEGAASVSRTEVRLKTVTQATADDLMRCDGIGVSSPTHMGTIAWEMKLRESAALCPAAALINEKVPRLN